MLSLVNACLRSCGKREFPWSGFLLPVIILLCTSARPTWAAERPDLILILADDLGRNDCGFMGGTQIKTPHLDRLARSGAVLDASTSSRYAAPREPLF